MISIILSFTALDAIALSLASGIGLALGVDYSLLIITRFREALDDGLAPRQAASLAANTAGRTAVFAGMVLVAIMMVSFFLSPGTVLLSSAVGAIVSAMLSMIGAALVAPAAVRAARPQREQVVLRRPRAQGPERVHRASWARVARRPALAAASVIALLLLVAVAGGGDGDDPARPAPAARGERGPRRTTTQVRAAGFGPTVEVAIRAPEGARPRPARPEADPALRAPAAPDSAT